MEGNQCGVSESYSGGQPKLLCSGLVCLRPLGTKIENRNISGKRFSHRPVGRHLNRDSMGRLAEIFLNRGPLSILNYLTN